MLAEALKTEYKSPSKLNNYVWLHIMHPELDGLSSIEELHRLIDEAISSKKDVNYYDAKACLYAMQKKFDQAISTETTGLLCTLDGNDKRSKAEAHLKCFRAHEACRTLRK